MPTMGVCCRMYFVLTVVLYLLTLARAQDLAIPKPRLSDRSFPTLTTSAYEVVETKPLSQTAIEVVDLACGQSHFCNSSLGTYSGANCFSCYYKCRCDADCHLYKDCCADIAFKDSAIKPQVDCVLRYPKLNNDKKLDSDYVFMVSKCPKSTRVSQATVVKCETANVTEHLQATPVTDLSTNIAYKNVFCAQCSGVQRYKVWTYKIECLVGSLAETASSKDELWRFVIQDQKCTVTNEPPIGTLSALRSCVNNVVSACNVTGKWDVYNRVTESLCQDVYHPVEYQDTGTNYRNLFCAMCNGAVVDRKKKCISFRRFNVVPRIKISFSKPLSVLIDFNSDPTNDEEPIKEPDIAEESQCDDGEMFNPLSRSCSAVLCSQRRLLSGGDCEPLFASSQGLGYTINLVVRPTDDVSVNNTEDIATLYKQSLQTTLKDFEPLSLTSLDFQPYVKKDSVRRNRPSISAIQVHGNLVSTAKTNLQSMEKALLDLERMNTYYSVDNQNVSLETFLVSCPAVEEQWYESGHVPEMASSFISTPRFQNCFGNSCIDGVEYLPLYGLLECPHIGTNLSETNASYDPIQMSLLLNNMTVFLNVSEHYYCGDSLKLCVSTVLRLQHLIKVSNDSEREFIGDEGDDIAMTILSIVCISLSLLCLLLTFIVYGIVSPLRTLPGRNTMALIFHLFFAQLVFQIGIQLTFNVDLCRAMAILIHYFWLTAFAWMAVCAYHMCATFTNMGASRFTNRSKETKILVKYIILCNVYAISFVTACVVYHVASSGGADIGYGGTICFLNGRTDIGVFFAAPLALVLVFNVICFVKTVHSIRNVPNIRSSKNKQDRNHIHVYFRLSILLGFTWIFGFVAAIFRTDALWYLFIILNGLQGLFIFAAYCLNRRTIRLIRANLNKKTGVKYSRPSKTSSSERHTHSTTM